MRPNQISIYSLVAFAMLSACKYYLPCHIPCCLESLAKKYGWGRNARSWTGPAFPPCYFEHTWNIYSSATIFKGLTKFIQGSNETPTPSIPTVYHLVCCTILLRIFGNKGRFQDTWTCVRFWSRTDYIKFVPESIGRSHYLTLMFISFEYYVWMQFIHSLLAKIKGE